MSDAMSPTCAACGASAAWVTTVRPEGHDGPGRLMPHCEACQREKARMVHVAIPLVMFGLDAPRLLELMYLSGVTATDPEVVTDLLGVPPGKWTEIAQRVIPGDLPPGTRAAALATVGDWSGVLPPDRGAPATAAHRRAQGEWRTEVLGWPAGPPTEPRAAERYPTLPNCLAKQHRDVAVDTAGVNLMSMNARSYAAARAVQVEALGGLVETDRLYRNLLSSQPLAFSIAGEFRAHPQAAALVLGGLLGRPINKLVDLEGPDELVPAEHRTTQTKSGGYRPLEEFRLGGIEAEWFPPRWAHTNDQSGFDLAACGLGADGERLLVSIEVKYIDSFSRAPVTWNRYRHHLEAIGVDEVLLAHLVSANCSQVLRQVMITESLLRTGLVPGALGQGRVDDAVSVVLGRAKDARAREVVRTLRVDAGLAVQFWSISELLTACADVATLRDWAARMSVRYLRAD